MIKSILIILLGILIAGIYSCNDSTINPDDNTINYHDSVVNVNLTKVNWFTTIVKNNDKLYFGNIFLNLQGSTNAENIFIETYGDGVVGWHKINLNSNNTFQDTINISFSPSDHSLKGTETSKSTRLMAIKSNDTLIETLNSGKIYY